MMTRKLRFAVVIAASIISNGCSLIDPTEVVNPNLTEENILNSGISKTGAWVAGMERQLALTYNEIITLNELASDNYTNSGTYFNQLVDVPTFNNTDPDINNALLHLSRLREYSLYGLNVVKPSDPSTTPDQEAELHFFVGLSQLLLGELFVSAPAVPNGSAVSAEDQLNAAISHFKSALDLTTDEQKEVCYNIVLSRAYHKLGNKTEARKYANDAVSASDDYVRFVEFDAVNGPVSDIQDALFDRGNFDDLQPLPRLDFLDPKYPFISSSEEAPVPVVKIEEAYLILAEADLADNLVPAALLKMQDLIDVVEARPTSTFSDKVEGRTQASPGSRPNTSDVTVAASAGEPQKAGLVLERQAPSITVPTVSGTSIKRGEVTILNYPTVDAALELLYLLRQEVFFAEGRRIADLGLKYPVSNNEIVSNPNINEGDDATIGQIPSFIPKGEDMDAFTFDKDAKTVVIKFNMNKILVQNKANPMVIPFF